MGLGLPELIIILIAILLFVGPKKLPEVGEALGKAMNSFRKGMSGDSSSGGSAKDAPAQITVDQEKNKEQDDNGSETKE